MKMKESILGVHAELSQANARIGQIAVEACADCERMQKRVEELENALRAVSLGSQNSMETKESLGKIARKAIGPPKYNLARIAWELERTAMGDGYYGNSLFVAKQIPQVNDIERGMLERWLIGSNTIEDGFDLQRLALKLDSIDRSLLAKGTK